MNNTIMAHDPSIRAWGWAVIGTTGKVLKAGCIKTECDAKKRRIRKGDDNVRRINEINIRLLQIIKRYKVGVLISEQPHGSQSASAAMSLGMVIGMLQTVSDCMELPLEWYSEGDSKLALLGRRSASKGETIEGISRVYVVPWTGVGYKDEAIADAMSIYHLAKKQSPLIKILLK